MTSPNTMISLSPLHFARDPRQAGIVGWYTEWKRAGQDAYLAQFVQRNQVGVVQATVLPMVSVVATYHAHEMTEGEARAADEAVVGVLIERYKVSIREGLLFLLGKDLTSDLFADVRHLFYDQQLQFLEALIFEGCVRELRRQYAGEQDAHVQQWMLLERAVKRYLDYCREDLFRWYSGILRDTPPEYHFTSRIGEPAKAIEMLHVMMRDRAYWDDLVELILAMPRLEQEQ